MAFNSQIEGELRKRMAAQSDDLLNHLGAGVAEDYCQYREKVGYLRALRDVLTWLGEINEDLNKG